MSKKAVSHPTTEAIRQAAWTRCMELRDAHRIASDRMWAGTLSSEFTAFELALISPLLSPRDWQLIRSTTRSSDGGTPR